MVAYDYPLMGQPPPRLCLPLVVLMAWTAASASETVPTPSMACSMDMSHDSRRWVTVNSSGNEGSLLVEMLPDGQLPDSWRELVTITVAFDSQVSAHVDAWRARLAAVGARIASDRELPDGSRLVRYASSDESGVWKFTQGPDGVYGVSYQWRPNQGEAPPRAWLLAVESSSLVKNSSAQEPPSP